MDAAPSTITEPIIIDEHGDLDVFRDVAAAESSLEAIDVRNGEYEAFDASGQRLSLTVERKTTVWLFGLVRWTRERVRISAAVPPSNDAHELCRRMRDYLARSGGAAAELVGMTLDELLAAVIARAGIS